MNKARLADSIEVFKRYYLLDRAFYDQDERRWKVELGERFQEVFDYDSVVGESFLDSLTALFEDATAKETIIWLCGGAFYQHQRFLDLLKSRPSRLLLSER